MPIGDTQTFASSFSDTLPSGISGSVLITPNGYSAVSATNVSLTGTTYSYSIVVQYDVVHTSVITLSMGSISQHYTWSTGLFDTSNIFTYPSIQSSSTLQSDKYTIGFSQISRTFTFNDSVANFEITGNFQSNDGSHNGTVSFLSLIHI